jgi:hypothetical protein
MMIILTVCYFYNTGEQNVMYHELILAAEWERIVGFNPFNYR